MFIQVALDVSDVNSLRTQAENARLAGVDRIEIGTPTALCLGQGAVDVINEYEFSYVYLDTKVIDFVELTLSSYVNRHSVSAFSVHGTASDNELTSAVTIRRARSLDLYVTTIGLGMNEAVSQSLRCLQHNISGIIAHGRGAPIDAFGEATGLLRELMWQGVPPTKIVLAGGIDSAQLRSIRGELPYELSGIIVGRSIAGSDDPREELRRIVAELEWAY